MRVAIYARVSTFDQEPENQLAELRQYVERPRLDVGGIRGPRRQRIEGSPAGARSTRR